MKKLVQINVVCNGSTGRIMCDIAKKAKENGFEAYCFYGRGQSNKDVNCIKIENKIGVYFHVLLTRFFNKHGHGSYFATNKMIKRIKKIDPDIIHLHNIHGYYLNLKMLFNYLSNDFKGKVIWTFHDCWAFTGHCSHFTAIDCNKWKDECYNCPQVHSYPKSIFYDSSKSEYRFKKKLFTSLKDLTVITPSNWLASLVSVSFFKKYDINVINNGIDLNIFKPTYDDSIYEKYNIPKSKKVILGVANIWEERKGFNIFLSLANLISDDEVIILVGLTEKQINTLPNNIIGIKRTENSCDLAKIYTLSSVFVNPSLEETFSLVTAEAMACGVPVVVCNTSAIKELVTKDVGFVVKNHTVQEYHKYIKKMLKSNIKSIKKYKVDDMVKSYYSIYKEVKK